MPCPGYLPKVQLTVEGEAHYALIVICLLLAATADPTELALCPVAALCAYDRFTQQVVLLIGNSSFCPFKGMGVPSQSHGLGMGNEAFETGLHQSNRRGH